ncbi:MAG: hypothetical protein J7J31_07730 [Helicobacteraceae bacterium]|nr:hypothetical protein [Helicobacteraceae bacterium]
MGCSSGKESLQVDTNLTAYSEDMVELQASGALAYSWRQLSGTDVIFVNVNKATASFITPSVTGQESLVFELEAVTVQFQNKNITSSFHLFWKGWLAFALSFHENSTSKVKRKETYKYN